MENELAIVGMAARLPGADTIAQFWDNLRNGVESIRQFNDDELTSKHVPPEFLAASNYVKAGAVLDGVDLFDASFFGFSPREAELMDPQHRLFLECAWEAMEHAGCDPDHFSGLIGVYAGTSLSSYLLFNLLENPDIRNAQDTFPIMVGNDKDFLSTRASYHLNLRGPSLDIQTGCSTSLVAFHLACEALLSCECDLALAGGVSINVPQRTGYFYHPGGVVSPDGHCRAFDEKAQGTVFGSGIGIVALKRLTDALADRNTIYALVKGSAVNNDGSLKVGYTAPGVDGQAEVIARAQAVAQVSAASITYLEAHGTGTPLGDPVEVQALTKAFRATTEQTGFCAIGSVKTNVGHLDAAAGITGLIKTVLALYHRQIPPMPLFSQPNNRIDFTNTPFYINRKLIDWSAGGPRRAGVSSFGIGGTNAHVVLEEPPQAQPSQPGESPQVLVFSGKTTTAVETMMSRLAEHLSRCPGQNLSDVAYTLQVGRKAFKHRRAIVCRDRDVAIDLLRALSPERILRGSASLESRSAAFLFPGQGSQHVGMAQGLYKTELLFREHVDHCCEVAARDLGFDLRDVLFPKVADEARAAEQLKQTSITQPALFIVSWAMAQLWMSWGIRPQAMLGHSIGEYVAATLAGVFTLEDALRLVVLRGQMMQQLPPGAMLAAAISEAEAMALASHNGLSLAACNGPQQCVFSGDFAAIAKLEDSLTSRCVSFQRLATSHAFHSAMLEPIVAPFMAAMEKMKLSPPSIPVISNVTGEWLTSSEATDPSYWAQHLRRTVRFSQGVDLLVREPEWVLLEVGPGQTLGNLVRRHPGRQPQQAILASLGHPTPEQSDADYVRTTVARLWLLGMDVQWQALHKDCSSQRIALPTYPFERQSYWIYPQKRLNLPSAEKKNIEDWFYIPSWKRMPAHRPVAGEPQPEAMRWLVFDDGSEFSSRVVLGLERAQHTVFRIRKGGHFQIAGIRAYEIDPSNPDHFLQLVRSLRTANAFPDRVLHLWNSSLSSSQKYPEAAFREAQTSGLYSMLHLAHAIASDRSGSLGIWIVTPAIHDVTGHEVISPENATMQAFCKVLPQEFPHVSCHSIDLVPDSPSEGSKGTAEQVLTEVLRSDPEVQVAFRNGQRWVPWFAPTRMEALPASASLKSYGVYLIVGGLGNIGLTLADYLSETVSARLALVTRASFPARSKWSYWLSSHDQQDKTSQTIRRLQAIEARGGEILIASADVSNKHQMQAVLDRVQQQWGNLHGVIHAAGDSGEGVFRSVEEMDQADCERHFQSKAHGLYVLDELLASLDLDFRLLFSSNAAVLGGPGLLAYSAAHLFMDTFASAGNRARDPRWTSIDWDYWLAPSSHQKHVPATITKTALPASEALQALKILLDHGITGPIAVSAFDLNARWDEWIRGSRPVAGDQTTSGTLHSRPVLESTYLAPQSELEKIITEIWQEHLAIEGIGIHDNFFDLGGNSLIGIQVMGKMNEKLQTSFPILTLFERSTISALAKLVAAQHEKQPEYEKRHSRGERRRERLLSRAQVNENA